MVSMRTTTHQQKQTAVRSYIEVDQSDQKKLRIVILCGKTATLVLTTALWEKRYELQHWTTGNSGNLLTKFSWRRRKRRICLKATYHFKNTLYLCPLHLVSRNILCSGDFCQNLCFALKKKSNTDRIFHFSKKRSKIK